MRGAVAAEPHPRFLLASERTFLSCQPLPPWELRQILTAGAVLLALAAIALAILVFAL
jgi:uncharacterized membrane protein YidH (DUF202 family)